MRLEYHNLQKANRKVILYDIIIIIIIIRRRALLASGCIFLLPAGLTHRCGGGVGREQAPPSPPTGLDINPAGIPFTSNLQTQRLN